MTDHAIPITDRCPPADDCLRAAAACQRLDRWGYTVLRVHIGAGHPRIHIAPPRRWHGRAAQRMTLVRRGRRVERWCALEQGCQIEWEA